MIWARVSKLTSEWGFRNHSRLMFLASFLSVAQASRIHAAQAPAKLANIALRLYRKAEAHDHETRVSRDTPGIS